VTETQAVPHYVTQTQVVPQYVTETVPQYVTTTVQQKEYVTVDQYCKPSGGMSLCVLDLICYRKTVLCISSRL